MPKKKYDYDVALSFAGEDRKYVHAVAEALLQLGVKVFYDEYAKADLWGKNLYTHLDDVYRKKSQFCVMFISKAYKRKLWTNHERESAQARAFETRKDYILPARFDSTKIPGVRSTRGHIDLRNVSPTELAQLIAKKIGRWDEVEDMLGYLRKYIPDYTITVEGTDVRFQSSVENYDNMYPVRMLLDLHRIDWLHYMFIDTGVLPG